MSAAIGLLGEHLGHSLSPRLHGMLAAYRYDLFEVSPEQLGLFLARRAFRGLNVTIPYKQAVLPYLDALDPSAANIGAVNTILHQNGRLIGYNTDFGGLVSLVSRAGIDPRGKRALILGTGGTAATAHAALASLGAAQITHVSRTPKDGSISYEEALARKDAQLLVNTTPVGMTPHADTQPIDLAAFPALEGMLDVIYTPLRTNLTQQAAALGIPAAGGLWMLVRQAVLSAALFRGEEFAVDPTEQVFNALEAQTQNLVLIGMPGCGKTTVGRLLAKRLGRPFFDSDAEIKRRTGQTIPVIFAQGGEPAFREREAAVLRELSGQQGAVIATGGGAILREENLRRLRRNGRLVFLDRPLAALPVDAGHPLSDTPEKLTRLYESRRPLYLAAADETVSAAGTSDEVVERLVASGSAFGAWRP